jgi:hypothetical protein
MSRLSAPVADLAGRMRKSSLPLMARTPHIVPSNSDHWKRGTFAGRAPVARCATVTCNPLKNHNRPWPHLAAFYPAILFGPDFLQVFAIVVLPFSHQNIRHSTLRREVSASHRDQVRRAPLRAHRRAVAAALAQLSNRRGTSCYRIHGAASQAFERGPPSLLRAPATGKISCFPSSWSVPSLIRLRGPPQSARPFNRSRKTCSSSRLRIAQPLLLGGRPRGDILRAGGRIADVEGAIAPHRMHHHGELSGDRHARLGMAFGLRQLQPQLLRMSRP